VIITAPMCLSNNVPEIRAFGNFAGRRKPRDLLLKRQKQRRGDLFYTQVKYLRRAKDGPKGLVIPTQEKNLHVKVDENRLRILENCRVD